MTAETLISLSTGRPQLNQWTIDKLMIFSSKFNAFRYDNIWSKQVNSFLFVVWWQFSKNNLDFLWFPYDKSLIF